MINQNSKKLEFYMIAIDTYFFSLKRTAFYFKMIKFTKYIFLLILTLSITMLIRLLLMYYSKYHH